MSLVGVPLSADKAMLTKRVDQVLALQLALAVLKGGQEVKGYHLWRILLLFLLVA